MSNRKSNQNICDFYKDKSEDTLTIKCFDTLLKNKKSNKYLGIYEDFCRKEFSCDDNTILFEVIKAWENIESAEFPIKIYDKDKTLIRTIQRSEMPNLDFLKNIGINLLNPNQNNGEEKNQKWHLFVCVFTYSVVCSGKSFKWENDFRKWPCKVLRLWMIENAENQEDALKKIKAAIVNDNLKDAKELINNIFNTLLEEG